jgi:hypothetical protein
MILIRAKPMCIRAIIGSAVLTAMASLPAPAQLTPAVRPLGAMIRASERDLLGSVTAIRILPGGRLIVNDITRRQVLLLDSTLSHATIITDSSKVTGGTFGLQGSAIIAYRGDSTLLVDPGSLSMLVIDPSGNIARVMAAPRPQDIGFLVGGPFGMPAFDGDNRLIYRGSASPIAPVADSKVTTDMPFQLPVTPDSAPIVRLNLSTRRLDTLSLYRVSRVDAKIVRDEGGRLSVKQTVDPMQVVDDWAVLSDGTLAVIRGRDYHLDLISATGARLLSIKIPFHWHRMTDEDRLAVLDSARIELNKELAAIKATLLNSPAATARSAPIGDSPPLRRRTAPAEPTIDLVDASSLPEYRPAFQPGSARADRLGNLWIRTSDTGADGALVYDVIDRRGQLTERIQFPRGRVLAGFGERGTVFMGVRDGADARVEEAKIR